MIPVSAKRALLARLILSNNANEAQKHDFYEKAFGEEYDKTDLTPQKIEIKAKSQLQKSGFGKLEEEVISVLFNKGIDIFLSSIREDLDRCLTLVLNELNVQKSSLEIKESDVERIIKQISTIKNRLAISDDNLNFKKKIENIVEIGFRDFEKEMVGTINNRFKTNKFRQKSSFDYIKNRFPYFFKHNEILVFNSSEERDYELLGLNSEITKTLLVDFENYWSPAIKKVYKEYEKFSNQITEKIKPVIREIENEINIGLNIHLNVYAIPKINVSQNDFFRRLNIETGSIIQENTGWKIKWFLNIIPYPTYVVTSYTIETSTYLNMLCLKIRELIDEYIEETNNIIQNELLSVLSTAKEEVDNYVGEYENVMQNAILQKKGADFDLASAIHTIQKDIEICNQLIGKLHNL